MSASGTTPFVSQPPAAVLSAYQRALDTYSIVSMTDRRGVITFINSMFCQISGYDHDELVGSTHALLNSGHHDTAFFTDMWRTIATGKTWTGEVCNRAKDGSTYWVDTVIIPLLDDDQHLEGYMSVRKEISARKAVETELQRSETFLKNVADVSKVGGWSLELDTQTLFWSDQTKSIHDLPKDFVPRLDEAINYYAPEARATITHAVENAINTGQSWDLELPMITATGRNIWVRAVGHLLQENGTSPVLVGAFQDITERKQVEDALRREIQQRHTAEQLLRDVLETIPDAVAAYDKDDRLIIFNKSYLETYAASAEAIVPGAQFRDIVRFGLDRGQYAEVDQDQAAKDRWLEQRVASHKNPPEQLNQKLRDGTWLQVREHRSATGTIVGVRTDITAMKRAEEKLRRFAEEDQLTGLFNRSRFCLELDEILAGLNKHSHTFGCVVLLDVDHFKPINDSYGHDVGDEVLIEIAHRIQCVLESSDVAGRLGGDEFVFALSGRADQAACDAVAQKLSNLMEQPIQTKAGSIKLNLSMGIASFVDGSLNSRQLLKQADLAQYRAKEKGRAQRYWFNDDDRQNLLRNSRLGDALNACLGSSVGLDCSFTPVANAQDGAPMGFHAELKWEYEGQVLAIPQLHQLAQKTGQSARLSLHKLTHVLEIVGAHETRGIGVGNIWITINADSLKISQFPDRLCELCETYGVAPSQLTIAVDETALVERSASAVEAALKGIRDAGMSTAIDMFGAAASSLRMLDELNITKVRLSSDITDALADDTAKDSVARGLIGIAKTLDIQVYATQVQTPAHAVRLADLGCDVLQGSIVGEALNDEQLAEHLGSLAAQKLAGLSVSMRDMKSPSAENAA